LTSVYKLLNRMWRERPETLRSLMRRRLVEWRREACYLEG
jgi:ribosomal protein L15E